MKFYQASLTKPVHNRVRSKLMLSYPFANAYLFTNLGNTSQYELLRDQPLLLTEKFTGNYTQRKPDQDLLPVPGAMYRAGGPVKRVRAVYGKFCINDRGRGYCVCYRR